MVSEAIPVLRVANTAESVAWYTRLGYEKEWEHRFEPGMPAFVSMARQGAARMFESARHLCSWAGMTPKLYESDTKSYKGKITKQGSTIVRWVLVESVARYHGGAPIEPTYRRIAERRGGKIGNKIAKVAAARKLLTLVFYGLRDGEIRCLAQEAA